MTLPAAAPQDASGDETWPRHGANPRIDPSARQAWSAGTGGVSASVLQPLNKLWATPIRVEGLYPRNPESVRGTADVGQPFTVRTCGRGTGDEDEPMDRGTGLRCGRSGRIDGRARVDRRGRGIGGGAAGPAARAACCAGGLRADLDE